MSKTKAVPFGLTEVSGTCAGLAVSYDSLVSHLTVRSAADDELRIYLKKLLEAIDADKIISAAAPTPPGGSTS